MSQLSRKQYLPMTEDEQSVLHREAARAGLSHGLLARVLLLHGLDHVDDQEVAVRVEQEKAAGRERIRAGARTAARARWGDAKEGSA